MPPGMDDARLPRRGMPPGSSQPPNHRYSYAYDPQQMKEYEREREYMIRHKQSQGAGPMVDPVTGRALPSRPYSDYQGGSGSGSGGRRKLPEIPRSAKLIVRPQICTNNHQYYY